MMIVELRSLCGIMILHLLFIFAVFSYIFVCAISVHIMLTIVLICGVHYMQHYNAVQLIPSAPHSHQTHVGTDLHIFLTHLIIGLPTITHTYKGDVAFAHGAMGRWIDPSWWTH